jgi:hypothetical protein
MSRTQRQWAIHRQVIPSRDGWRSFDQAYQLLLQWTQPKQEEPSTAALLDQENSHETCLVRPRLYPAAGPNTDN